MKLILKSWNKLIKKMKKSFNNRKSTNKSKMILIKKVKI